MGFGELFFLLLLLFGCVRQDTVPAAEVDVEDVELTSANDILSYGEQFFPEGDGWRVFQTSEASNQSVVAWVDAENTAVVQILEFIIPPDIDPDTLLTRAWVRENGFASGYTAISIKNDCEQDGIHLFEVRLELQDTPYFALTWMSMEEERILRRITLIFPSERRDELDSYAALLFPDFATCE